MSPARAAAGRRRLRTSPYLHFSDALTERTLDDVALVVLRAPRGFGKTALLGYWLERGHLGPDAVYVSLRSSVAGVDDFWREILAALDRSGATESLTGPSEASGNGRGRAGIGAPPAPRPVPPNARAAVAAALSMGRRPLTLVIDHLHRIDDATDAEIDHGLLELLVHHPDLRLVVATRSLRPLEVTGLMSVPSRQIDAGDLRLDPARAGALAVDLGAGLSRAMVERLVRTTDGWPALVRTTLARGTDGEGALRWDPTVIDAFLTSVIDDFGDERVRDFLYRTSLVGAFSLDHARALMERADAQVLVRPLHHAGLLRVDGVDTYTYAPAVRESLERLAREREPELVKEVHRHLLRVSAPTIDPARSLHHAVLAEEWDRGIQLLERYWSRLVTQSPHALIAAARAFPGEHIAASARLRVALTDLPGGVVATLDGQEHSWQWPAVGEPDGVGRLGVTGDGATRIEQDESAVLLQWALAAMFSGDLRAATYACNRARNRGLARGSRSAAALGTVGLAVLHMFQGELVQGRRFLEDPVLVAYLAATGGGAGEPVRGDPPEDPNRQHLVAAASVGAIVDQGVRVARAMDAVDSGSAESAGLVADLVEPAYRDIVWMLTVSVRARYAALTDDLQLVLDAANQLRAALRYVAVGTLPEAVLVHDLIDVLIRVGMLGAARDLDARTGNYPLALLSRVKLAMADRQYHQAITLAESIGSWLTLWPRVALERDVVLASAYHAVGRGHEAAEQFLAAVHAAHVHGQARPFGLMPRYVFDALAAGNPYAQQLWPDPRTRPTAEDTGHPVFTDREAQVLRALVEHGGPVAIAAHLGLSTNTAKTHVRNIYKKLGVTNRSQALVAAERLLTG